LSAVIWRVVVWDALLCGWVKIRYLSQKFSSSCSRWRHYIHPGVGILLPENAWICNPEDIILSSDCLKNLRCLLTIMAYFFRPP